MLAEDCKATDKECHHCDKEWDQATGGVWLAGLPIIHGYMLQLAQHNHDHFLPHAKTAYLVGHEYAIKKAREAGKLEISNSLRWLDIVIKLFLTKSSS